jgi:hypothetical protein
MTSRSSSWHDGKELGVPDSVLNHQCGIQYVTIIVEPEVILCLTFVILAAS